MLCVFFGLGSLAFVFGLPFAKEPGLARDIGFARLEADEGSENSVLSSGV